MTLSSMRSNAISDSWGREKIGERGRVEREREREKEDRRSIEMKSKKDGRSARRGSTSSSSCNLDDVERSEMGTAWFRREGNADAVEDDSPFNSQLGMCGFRQHAASLNSRVKWITRSDSRPLKIFRSAEIKDSGDRIFRILRTLRIFWEIVFLNCTS